jgi:Lrp/AsnC family leucine-responsive transcriptional regulator
MDQKDHKILGYLMENGRDKISDISRELDIPRVTVHERIQGMMKSGVIRKFTAVPDYEAIGLKFTAFIFVGFSANQRVSQRDLAKKIAQMREVSEVHIITGQWDLLLKARGNTLKEIGDLVLDRLREMEGIEKTETVAVFQTVKD